MRRPVDRDAGGGAVAGRWGLINGMTKPDLTTLYLTAGGVYAINYDGKMIVKTVARDKLTQKWVARSFSPSYPDIALGKRPSRAGARPSGLGRLQARR